MPFSPRDGILALVDTKPNILLFFIFSEPTPNILSASSEHSSHTSIYRHIYTTDYISTSHLAPQPKRIIDIAFARKSSISAAKSHCPRIHLAANSGYSFLSDHCHSITRRLPSSRRRVAFLLRVIGEPPMLRGF